MSYTISSPAHLVQPSPGAAPPGSQGPSIATAITSQDGTVTINIRRPEVPAPIPPPPLSLCHNQSEEDMGVVVEQRDLHAQYQRAIYQGLFFV